MRPNNLMKGKVKVGLTGTVRFTVEPQYTIDFGSGAMPPVLATPWLIKFLEQAGREALKPLLEEGENSVGTQVDIRHLAPTPPGHQVTCTARVIHADDRLVDFQVEACDETELIARGLHQRAVIRVERFARRVAQKSDVRPQNHAQWLGET